MDSQSTREAHRFAFSLFGSFWDLLEGMVWLVRIAESLSYDFQTTLHSADVVLKYFSALSIFLSIVSCMLLIVISIIACPSAMFSIVAIG